ncbi:MAG: hypothetical protein V7637_601 [Mycobacteriales bacterium]|jgi:enamine deaminase RidA (YjgF/YER057c/UK114 family)
MIDRLNPDGMHATPGYAHVTTTERRRLVFLAGQVPLAGDGSLVGEDDLPAQVAQVVRNIGSALAAAGATPHDVVRTVIYVVSDQRADLAAVWTALRSSPFAPALTTASTLLGVARLGFAGQLVEVDVTAALAG